MFADVSKIIFAVKFSTLFNCECTLNVHFIDAVIVMSLSVAGLCIKYFINFGYKTKTCKNICILRIFFSNVLFLIIKHFVIITKFYIELKYRPDLKMVLLLLI